MSRRRTDRRQLDLFEPAPHEPTVEALDVQLVGEALDVQHVEAPRPRRTGRASTRPATLREIADPDVLHMSRGLDLTLCGCRVAPLTLLACSREGVTCKPCKRRMAPREPKPPRRGRGTSHV